MEGAAALAAGWIVAQRSRAKETLADRSATRGSSEP
jgi:hypothetical protein